MIHAPSTRPLHRKRKRRPRLVMERCAPGRSQPTRTRLPPTHPRPPHCRRLALNTAFQLVDAGSDGKLRLVQESVERLHALRLPMDVVAVVGPFHSGKSFLLNSLMGKSSSVDGFKLGYSVEPTTKGIW